MNTPWGISQSVKDLGDGVVSVSTSSHGGYKLTDEANAKVPDYMRRSDGWYEEDVDWAIVATVFPHLFPKDALPHAEKTLRGWRPDAWEKFFNMKLAPGQSYIRDERNFMHANKDAWLVISAISSYPGATIPKGMVLVTATKGGKRGVTGAERCFLVPADEYRANKSFSFVVDEARHERVNCPW